MSYGVKHIMKIQVHCTSRSVAVENLLDAYGGTHLNGTQLIDGAESLRKARDARAARKVPKDTTQGRTERRGPRRATGEDACGRGVVHVPQGLPNIRLARRRSVL